MNQVDPALVQYGVTGILLVIVYFAGRIAMVYVTASAATQTKLIDGNFDRMKEMAEEIAENTKATVELMKALQQLTATVISANKNAAEEHRFLIEGIKRMGGYRPSGDMPAQRVQRKPEKKEEPDSG